MENLSLKLILVSTLLHATRSSNIHLGILIPVNGSWNVGNGIRPIIDRAISAVNNLELLQGYNITYTTRNSQCSSYIAAGLASEMLHFNPPVNAIIGPGCSEGCLSAGLLANYWNKVMISYSCSSTDLENKKKFPTFARTQAFSRTYSAMTPRVLRKIMEHYNWKRAAIIAPYGNSGYGIWEPIASEVRDHFVLNNLTVSYYKAELVAGYGVDANKRRMDILEEIKKHARVIFILATRSQFSTFVSLAKDQGMLNGSYAFITLDFYITNSMLRNEDVLDSLNGIISLTVKRPSMSERKETGKWLLEQGLLKDPNFTVSLAAERTAAYLHDAILLYAHAVNQTLQDNNDLNDGKSIFKHMIAPSPLFKGREPSTSVHKSE